MEDQHAKLSVICDVSSFTNNTKESNTNNDALMDTRGSRLDYEYVENCDRFPSTSDRRQKVANGPYRSTWNERGVFFFASLGFTTGFHGVCVFPVLCELNGGAAFLVCTAILYLVCKLSDN
ncbi:sodium- and chloride-dependent GABA transporter 1-like [Zootermopsis nevadensis]|uniref:sodium- and chloride-dependent GABA transporter 1-like n=1 Tax=Zootermopsis nevadensis TaxID=136037 RepID=UPI000B8EB0AD|nr:sodium- and chloride-dependent GABA transporter 1-like [Zootermopsis nevadensis]